MPPERQKADLSANARVERLAEIARKRRYWPARAKAFGPAILFALAGLALAAIGAIGALPAGLESLVSLGLLLGIAGSFAYGLATYRRPDAQSGRDAVDALMEGAPASALRDRPTRINADTAALWRAHKARLAQDAAQLKAPSASADWSRVDPWRLRYIAPVAAGACLLVVGEDSLRRIAAATTPDIGALFGAHLVTAEAWVAPPPYTGKAPFDLPSGDAAQSPAGSQLTVRITSVGAPKLKITDGDASRTEKLERGPDGVFEAQLTLEDALSAEIHWWGARARFDLSSLPDAPPITRFVQTPTVDEHDRTRFLWYAADDYGVAELGVSFQLETPHPGAPDEEAFVAVDLPGVEPREAVDEAALDLTRHRWAGLPVVARLKATDAAGQIAYSDTASFKLPEKLFLQPLAQASAEVRAVVLREPRDYSAADARDGFADTTPDNPFADAETARLERAPPDIRRAAVMLDALTHRPERYFQDPALYLGLRQARGVLSTSLSKADAEASEDVLWAVALRAEYGDLADAAARLQAAKEALEQALRDGASEDELRRLMKAFRQAVENYMAAQLAEARRTGRVGENRPEGSQLLQGADLQEMLDALEDLAETGAADQARQLLSDMTDMLERMRNFQITEGGDGEGMEMDGPMSEALRDLSDALRDQRELNDDTFSEQRRQQNQSGPEGQPGGEAPQSGQGDPPPSGQGRSPQALAERQEALRRALEEAFGPDGENGRGSENEGEGAEDRSDSAEARDGRGRNGLSESLAERLADAEAAQRRAEEALRRGDLERAGIAQRDAADALRDAATELAETADRLRDEANGEDGRDPLGRNTGGADAGYGDDVVIPDEAERQRARDILDELRRRSGDPDAREDEIEYLRRLLRRF